MSFFAALVRPIAYLSVPIVIIRSITAVSPAARYCVRVAMYMSTLTFIATWGVAVAAVMSVSGNRYNVNWVVARSFYFLSSNIMDLEIDVEGIEHVQGPVVLMCNHQSVLDILVVGRIMPKRTSIMAKGSLRFAPMGPFMMMSGAIFVNRGNNAGAVRSLKAAGETIKNKQISLWMFPEGTRHMSQENDLLPLKKGGFHLAIQAGIPVLPVVVENYHWLYRFGHFGKGTIKVKVLPPVSTVGLKTDDCSDLVLKVRTQMLDTLREISRKIPSADSKVEEPTPSGSIAVDTPQLPPVVEDIPAAESLQTGKKASENGTDEEDDEMVLVGRPT